MIDFIYPKICPICLSPVMPKGETIHSGCIKKISYIKEPFCMKCGKHLESDESVVCSECIKACHKWNNGRCIFPYQSSVKRGIIYFKDFGIKELAAFYADQAVKRYGTFIKGSKADVIVPVPSFKRKYLSKGFNQAELFAKELSLRVDIPECNLLEKVKNTKEQKTLTKAERKSNLNDAFDVLCNAEVRPYKVLLVDDICTTGSTIDACTEALKKHGIEKVDFLGICRE